MSIEERNKRARAYSYKCSRREKRHIDRVMRKIDKALGFAFNLAIVVAFGFVFFTIAGFLERVAI